MSGLQTLEVIRSLLTRSCEGQPRSRMVLVIVMIMMVRTTMMIVFVQTLLCVSARVKQLERQKVENCLWFFLDEINGIIFQKRNFSIFELIGSGEEARVVCQVDANPAPTHFKWVLHKIISKRSSSPNWSYRGSLQRWYVSMYHGYHPLSTNSCSNTRYSLHYCYVEYYFFCRHIYIKCKW